jgi:hypothetical protein
MKLGDKISELENSGYDITIKHIREKDGMGNIKPKGGYTIARIYKDDLMLSNGVAVCSYFDNFNKQLGGIIALGRAIHDSPEPINV